jgi:hypothetical protein
MLSKNKAIPYNRDLYLLTLFNYNFQGNRLNRKLNGLSFKSNFNPVKLKLDEYKSFKELEHVKPLTVSEFMDYKLDYTMTAKQMIQDMVQKVPLKKSGVLNQGKGLIDHEAQEGLILSYKQHNLNRAHENKLIGTPGIAKAPVFSCPVQVVKRNPFVKFSTARDEKLRMIISDKKRISHLKQFKTRTDEEREWFKAVTEESSRCEKAVKIRPDQPIEILKKPDFTLDDMDKSVPIVLCPRLPSGVPSFFFNRAIVSTRVLDIALLIEKMNIAIDIHNEDVHKYHGLSTYEHIWYDVTHIGDIKILVWVHNFNTKHSGQTRISYQFKYGKYVSPLYIRKLLEFEPDIRNDYMAAKLLSVVNYRRLCMRKFLAILLTQNNFKAALGKLSYMIAAIQGKKAERRARIYSVIMDTVTELKYHDLYSIKWTLLSASDPEVYMFFIESILHPYRKQDDYTNLQLFEKLFKLKKEYGMTSGDEIKKQVIDIESVESMLSHIRKNQNEYFLNSIKIDLSNKFNFKVSDLANTKSSDVIEGTQLNKEVLIGQYASSQSWKAMETIRLNSSMHNTSIIKISALVREAMDVEPTIHITPKGNVEKQREISLMSPVTKMLCGTLEQMVMPISENMHADYLRKEEKKESKITYLFNEMKRYREDRFTAVAISLDASTWNQYMIPEVLGYFCSELMNFFSPGDARAEYIREISKWYETKKICIEGKMFTRPLQHVVNMLTKASDKSQAHSKVIEERFPIMYKILQKVGESIIETWNAMSRDEQVKYAKIKKTNEKKNKIKEKDKDSDPDLHKVPKSFILDYIYLEPLVDGMGQGILGTCSSIFGSAALTYVCSLPKIKSLMHLQSRVNLMCTSDDMELVFASNGDIKEVELLQALNDELIKFGIKLKLDKMIGSYNGTMMFNSNLYMPTEMQQADMLYKPKVSSKIQHIGRVFKNVMSETYMVSPLDSHQHYAAAYRDVLDCFDIPQDEFTELIHRNLEIGLWERRLNEFDLPVEAEPISGLILPNKGGAIFGNVLLGHYHYLKYKERTKTLISENDRVDQYLEKYSNMFNLSRSSLVDIRHIEFMNSRLQKNVASFIRDLDLATTMNGYVSAMMKLGALQRLVKGHNDNDGVIHLTKSFYRPSFRVGQTYHFYSEGPCSRFDRQLMKSLLLSINPNTQNIMYITTDYYDERTPKVPIEEALYSHLVVNGTIDSTTINNLAKNPAIAMHDSSEIHLFCVPNSQIIRGYHGRYTMPNKGVLLKKYMENEWNPMQPWIVEQKRSTNGVWIKPGMLVVQAEPLQLRWYLVRDSLIIGQWVSKLLSGKLSLEWDPVAYVPHAIRHYLLKYDRKMADEVVESYREENGSWVSTMSGVDPVKIRLSRQVADYKLRYQMRKEYLGDMEERVLDASNISRDNKTRAPPKVPTDWEGNIVPKDKVINTWATEVDDDDEGMW